MQTDATGATLVTQEILEDKVEHKVFRLGRYSRCLRY